MRDGPVFLFDLGGVLVQASGLATLKELLPHLERAEILARWHDSEAVGLFERGSIGPEAFARAFTAEWQLHLSPKKFLALFASWVQGFYPGAKDLLRNLRARHTVACLSNTNATHWAKLAEVQEHFHVCVASHLIGCMKPELVAYERALQEIDSSPGDLCFFYDQMPNVLAARAIGMKAFHVVGLSATVTAIHNAGIRTDEYA